MAGSRANWGLCLELQLQASAVQFYLLLKLLVLGSLLQNSLLFLSETADACAQRRSFGLMSFLLESLSAYLLLRDVECVLPPGTQHLKSERTRRT